MMMPANYSAISENEMTYVNGGAVALEDILAPKLTVADWQRFNTNMVTIIGNSYLSQYVSRTVGTLFSGYYVPGQVTRKWAKGISNAYQSGVDALGPDSFFNGGSAVLSGANGVLNAGLQLLGNAAAIYNLATANVGNDVSSKDFIGISKKPSI